MWTFKTISTYFLINLYITFVFSKCIFLDHCEVALKYIEKRRYDPKTIKILQNAHCGFGFKNGSQRPKVNCDTIPDFEDYPEDCIVFTECSPAMKLIENNRYDPETIALLTAARCGDSKRKDGILCKNITKSILARNKIDLLPKLDGCGLQMPEPKIFGGKFADIDEFPWIALIKYKNRTGHVQYGCHGSLISQKYVITAAHCLELDPRNKQIIGNIYSVVLGEYDIRNDRDCIFTGTDKECTDPVQEFSIESFRYHSNFRTDNLGNDIGLIRLKDTAIFSEFVKPICLPLLHFSPLKINETLWIAGWGKIENKTMSNIKLKAHISYITNQECEFRISYGPDNTQMCAGSTSGADTCRGDSGGPLMAQRNFNGELKTFLVGLVSFGMKCGSTAAIYTNVSQFTDWILENIEE